MWKPLAIFLALASTASAQWTNFPLPETPTEKYNVTQAVGELLEGCAERSWAVGNGSSNLILNTFYVADTDNPTNFVEHGYTNWYYPQTTNYATNVVYVGNTMEALAIVDSFMYGGHGYESLPTKFAPRSVAENAEAWWNHSVGTRWCYGDDSCWHDSDIYPDYVPYYFLGGSILDTAAYISVCQELDIGHVFTWTSSYEVVTNNANGYEVNSLCEPRNTPHQLVRVGQHTYNQHLLTLLPEEKFPTNGVTMFSFVYGPVAISNNSVAYYPEYVTLSGCEPSNYNGQYNFDGIVTDSTIWELTYPCYKRGDTYQVYLANDCNTLFPTFDCVQWTIAEEPAFGQAAYYSQDSFMYDSPEQYGKSQPMVGVGPHPPLGSNVVLTAPLSPSNWLVECGWQAQNLSPMVFGSMQIPFENYEPPEVRMTLGTTNHEWSDVLPFTCSNVAMRHLIAPSVVDRGSNYLAVLPHEEVTNVVMQFGSDGQPDTITNILVGIANTNGYDTYLYGERPHPVDGTCELRNLGDEDVRKHWGDRINVVWNKATGIYGSYADLSQQGVVRTWIPIYPQCLNERQKVLEALKYTANGDVLVDRSDQTVTGTAHKLPDDDTDVLVQARDAMLAQWPPAPNYTNHYFANGAGSSAGEGLGIEDWYREVPPCNTGDEFEQTCTKGESVGFITRMRASPVLSVRTNPVPLVSCTSYKRVEDVRGLGCNGDFGTECYNNWWSHGTGGKFVSHASATPTYYQTNAVSGFGTNIHTNIVWYANAQTPTSDNTEAPNMGDCVFEAPFSDGFDIQVGGTDPCGNSTHTECDTFFVSSGGRSYGRGSGQLLLRSIWEWDFKHQD